MHVLYAQIRAQKELDAATNAMANLEKERQRLLGLLSQHAERDRQEALGPNRSPNSSTRVTHSAGHDP